MISLALLGLALRLLVPQISTLTTSWSVVEDMIWWAVGLAAVAQVLSYLGSGYMLHAILAPHGEKLSTLKGVLISMASFSVGLVAGGALASSAATYSWVRQENRDGNTAILAGMLPSMLNDALLVTVALIGTIHLLLLHDLSDMQLIEFGSLVVFLGALAVAGLAAMRFPETATRLAVWLAGRWAALRREPFRPKDTIASMKQFVVVWEFLGKGHWQRPLLGAIANIAFDMATLYFLFVAAGYNVNFGILFAGYGLPFILGKAAFMFPGGIGVVEGSMVALYDSLNVPNPISVVVILGYRLFSFWLPALLGFAAVAWLARQTSATQPEQA
ncbi:MAG: YbhN family protein [Anaerolineales bacterium]